MAGKSRRGRKKQSFQSKKKKSGRSLRNVVQQQAVTQTSEPVTTPQQPLSSSVSIPTSVVKPAFTQYPYVIAELQRIGILAGIILVILIVLALVIS